MPGYLDTAKHWRRRTRRQNKVVQAEATQETLRRFRNISPILLLINVVYILAFRLFGWDVEAGFLAPHTIAIIQINSAMALCNLVLGTLSHLIYRRAALTATTKIYARLVQILICVSSLLFAISLAVVDQMLITDITSFVLISLLISMLSLMSPSKNIVLFALAYLLYFFSIASYQEAPELLFRLRGNGRNVLLMCTVVSIIVWRQYRESIILKREILHAHRALARKQLELEFLATHDPLTELYNRREFMRLAEMELARARRFPSATHIIIIDLDHFKSINDNYGHPQGDVVLKKIAHLLNISVRETDVVARLGGEEFIIFLPETAQTDACAVAEKLRKLIVLENFQVGEKLVPLRASFGVSGLQAGQSTTLDNLYLAADQALYQAKQTGRNRVNYAAPGFVASPAPLSLRGKAGDTDDIAD
jgi:diguanylate cyclase (GGDEF)-like protein